MELIATLGSNPLPVVVTALQLRPLRLHLICTTRVEPLAERVRSLVETKGIGRGEVLTLSEPAQLSSEQLEAELKRSTIPWEECDLDYTGGTKLIAAEVRAWWRQKNPTGTAIYLSEGGHLIFSPAQGGIGSLRVSVSLSFEELAGLHFEHGLACGDEHKESPHREIAQRILKFVCRDEPEGRDGFSEWMKLLPPVRLSSCEHNGVTYQNADGMLAKNCGSGGPLVRHDLTAMFNTIGVAGTTLDEAVEKLSNGEREKSKRRLATLKWLEGEWLEVALAKRLVDTGLFDEVRQNVHRKDGSSQGDAFQADIVAVKGHRAYLFTCTTIDKASQCKHKLFEAFQRVVRIGGEYSRVVLVSLMERPEDVLKAIREDGWAGYDQARSFGLPHLCGKSAASTLNPDGKPGPAQTLDDALRGWVNA